jgi:hypothetical protein
MTSVRLTTARSLLSVELFGIAAALVAMTAGSALAAISQTTIAAPGGFVQACAGPSTIGTPGWPGLDWTTAYFGGAPDRKEVAFAGNASASRSASFAGGTTSNSASGFVAMGFASMSASNNFTSTAPFSLGVANGGWKETFVISNPSHTGQAGTMVFTVKVVGRLDASGFTGSAAITTTAYKDNVQLFSNPLASPGNSDLLSTDRQYGNWTIATFGVPPTDGKNVNGTVTYAVPFTFGTPFSLGVYVNCRAGQRSSGGFDTPCTSNATLSQFNWNGITSIYAGATPVSGSTVISGTGINWGQPIEPNTCPADINGDTFVDDADFSLFAAAYNILDCADPTMPAGCPADLNSDGLVDDADFVLFAAAYDALLCP